MAEGHQLIGVYNQWLLLYRNLSSLTHCDADLHPSHHSNFHRGLGEAKGRETEAHQLMEAGKASKCLFGLKLVIFGTL